MPPTSTYVYTGHDDRKEYPSYIYNNRLLNAQELEALDNQMESSYCQFECHSTYDDTQSDNETEFTSTTSVASTDELLSLSKSPSTEVNDKPRDEQSSCNSSYLEELLQPGSNFMALSRASSAETLTPPPSDTEEASSYVSVTTGSISHFPVKEQSLEAPTVTIHTDIGRGVKRKPSAIEDDVLSNKSKEEKRHSETDQLKPALVLTGLSYFAIHRLPVLNLYPRLVEYVFGAFIGNILTGAFSLVLGSVLASHRTHLMQCYQSFSTHAVFQHVRNLIVTIIGLNFICSLVLPVAFRTLYHVCIGTNVVGPVFVLGCMLWVSFMASVATLWILLAVSWDITDAVHSLIRFVFLPLDDEQEAIVAPKKVVAVQTNRIYDKTHQTARFTRRYL